MGRLESFDRFICQERGWILPAGELVADAVDGLDSCGIWAEFFTKEGQALVKRARGAIVGDAPEAVQQLVAGEHLAGVVGEKLQQPEFARQESARRAIGGNNRQRGCIHARRTDGKSACLLRSGRE